MDRQCHQSGFAHLVIIVTILVVALIGTLGIVYYRNFVEKITGSVNTGSHSTSQSNGKTQPETRITTKVEDLPQSIQETAKTAEKMIIEAVGSTTYAKYYRFAPDRSIECSKAPVNNGQCVAFLYLPPSENGLTDTLLFARYVNGKLGIFGNIENCLVKAESCLFNITKEKAISIISEHGHNINPDSINLDSNITKSFSSSEWFWKASAPSDEKPQDNQCFYSIEIKVDISSGAYSENKLMSCA